jgi:hypothetical protein
MIHPSVAPLAAILDLHTDLLLNCLDRLSGTEVGRRGTLILRAGWTRVAGGAREPLLRCRRC